MTNVLYMCFGIFIFVLGIILGVSIACLLFSIELAETKLLEHLSTKRISKVSRKDGTSKREEHVEECEDTHREECEKNEKQYKSFYEDKITLYDDVLIAPPVPPVADANGLLDYAPSLHQEDIDVEIMTIEREMDLYKKATLGGV